MTRRRARRDASTPDLFAARRPSPAVRVDETRVRADTVAQRVSRAVAMALNDATAGGAADREAIAAAMTDYLGERVSRAMLDAYASPKRDEHRITVPRLIALCHALDDPRPLAALAALLGLAVVPQRWVPAIEALQLLEERAEIDRQLADVPAGIRRTLGC